MTDRDIEEPIYVAQLVEVHWTKDSRGGQAAATRNQVPCAHPLPVELAMEDSTRMFFQRIRHDEATGFKPSFETWSSDSFHNHQIGAFHVTLVEDGLQFFYVRDGFTTGRPMGAARRAHVLRPATSWRATYNGRLTGSHGNWSYRKATLNAAWLQTPSATAFTTGVPDQVFTDLHDLF